MENFTVDGINIAYEVHGEGDPVLCIGGTGMAPSVWQTFYMPPLLKAGYQVITFANRGIAPSDGLLPLFDRANGIGYDWIDRTSQSQTNPSYQCINGCVHSESQCTPSGLDRQAILIGGRTSSAYTRAHAGEKAMFQAGDIPEEYDFIDGLSSIFRPKCCVMMTTWLRCGQEF